MSIQLVVSSSIMHSNDTELSDKLLKMAYLDYHITKLIRKSSMSAGSALRLYLELITIDFTCFCSKGPNNGNLFQKIIL